MKSPLIPTSAPQRTRTQRHSALLLPVLLALNFAAPAEAATELADQPLFSSANVPGNLALPLSVEYPTAVSVAHVSGTYSSANSYQGYFDPDKCYLYKFVDVEDASNKTHFAPAGAATTHTCVGTNDYKWSGNYLNWAAMQTIDPFRWALTGGYRVVDTATMTIIEKAWHSGQGGTGNFPDRVLTVAADIQAATPFIANGNLTAYVQGRGNMARIASAGTAGTGGLLGTYFNTSDLDATGGTPVLTRTESVDFDWGNASPLATVVNTENFSARWVAAQTAPSTGNYKFETESDDGVRLWVNGVLVIDNWNDHSAMTNTTADIALTAGAPLTVRLEYYERTGGAEIKLRWKAPGAASFSVYTAGDWWSAPMRARVCDPDVAAGGVEKNCTAYDNGNYKPEGLMQQYSDRIRYSVFGYLNDSNIKRDGGVLRARQKFIGPTQPVPGSVDISNSAAEWNASTGVFNLNPDADDAADTATMIGSPITNSGVLNYLNKFGEITRGNYKSYDPVGELYYAALRYFKNLGNVSAWTDMSSAADNATKATWADGFPVITDWKKTVAGKDTGDPILYTCQRNFVLGIGDVNTHADKNVPGPTGTGNEPTKPGGELMGDTTFSSSINAVTATNKVGSLQGLGASLGTAENYGGCCNNNSALMAGLAYDANTRDIRPDLANPEGTVGQTVQTFWLDVLEYQTYKKNNQFYLAAKYGGFKAPATFDPYSASAALQTSWWNTTTDTVGSGSTLQPRPDNYYSSSRPDQMIDGLTKAFRSIASELKAYTTSFSTALPQVANTGNASYSAQYDASNWTGEIIASTLSFDTTTGAPSFSKEWTFSEKIATQLAGTGWNTGRKVVTWNGTNAGVAFRATGSSTVTSSQLTALDPDYVTGDDSSNYLNYLRGETKNEQGSTVTGSTKAYRARAKLVGDIVGSRTRPVGPPSFPFTDATNPGYSSFKTTYASRTTVLYVGANDGMLHAIDGRIASPGGNELFAYVPSALFAGPSGTRNVDGLASLGNPTYTHHYMERLRHRLRPHA
jgi:type IV pilus assembly protein PilY1